MTTRARIAEIQDPTQRKHFVYRIYDGNGELLYIGCTNNPERRWVEHRTDNKRMTAIARHFKLAGPYNYHTARRLEREALLTENPRFGMTPKRRGQHTRNAALQRKYAGQMSDRTAIARANREAPIDPWRAAR